MNEAWIIDACRTPRAIGKAGKGGVSGIHPQRLGAVVLKALAERNGLNTAEVDDISWATSSQRGEQGGDQAGEDRAHGGSSFEGVTPNIGARGRITRSRRHSRKVADPDVAEADRRAGVAVGLELDGGIIGDRGGDDADVGDVAAGGEEENGEKGRE